MRKNFIVVAKLLKQENNRGKLKNFYCVLKNTYSNIYIKKGFSLLLKKKGYSICGKSKTPTLKAIDPKHFLFVYKTDNLLYFSNPNIKRDNVKVDTCLPYGKVLISFKWNQNILLFVVSAFSVVVKIIF